MSKKIGCIFLLIGLQSKLRPPNRNKVPSDSAVSVCHDLPTGVLDTGILENIFCTTHSKTSLKNSNASLNINDTENKFVFQTLLTV